ncbi:hypothetical protein CAC42_905 [Sphaceloma murrayae]|uniref:Uncharacterized protein n=1 Tax=Sphaceloma murrayae TaxID=2082308 RepID=A0A2K1R2M9_9PEZI|nr:hypothetical protein CAC42_905 [Sphaceloma murrayae]
MAATFAPTDTLRKNCLVGPYPLHRDIVGADRNGVVVDVVGVRGLARKDLAAAYPGLWSHLVLQDKSCDPGSAPEDLKDLVKQAMPCKYPHQRSDTRFQFSQEIY